MDSKHCQRLHEGQTSGCVCKERGGGGGILIFGEPMFILKMVESINPGAFLWSLHVLHVSATGSVLVLLLPLSLKTFGEQR